jgi:hypothetical protein
VEFGIVDAAEEDTASVGFCGLLAMLLGLRNDILTPVVQPETICLGFDKALVHQLTDDIGVCHTSLGRSLRLRKDCFPSVKSNSYDALKFACCILLRRLLCQSHSHFRDRCTTYPERLIDVVSSDFGLIDVGDLELVGGDINEGVGFGIVVSAVCTSFLFASTCAGGGPWDLKYN